MSRVVLLDESTGLYYSVLQDSLRVRKGVHKVKAKVLHNAQARALQDVEDNFKGFEDTSAIARSLASVLGNLAKGEVSSVTVNVYGGEIQFSFWEKSKGAVKGNLVCSFSFTSPAGFIAGVEEYC
jgi:hypothetical protein